MNDKAPLGRAMPSLTAEEERARFGTSIEEAPNNLPAVIPPARAISVTDGVITAQPVEVKRNEVEIRRKLAVRATMSGEDWFYRFPVKKKVKDPTTGKESWETDWIEGPSIKCANNVANLYGNCQVDTRVADMPDHWMIYARFVDYETGFSYTRPFQQRKAQGSIGGQDSWRKQDIAMQIGVSKAIRNVICNALELFTTFAFEEAHNNIVEKIGKDIEKYRTKLPERLKEMGVDVRRVELSLGRKVEAWLATDIARTIAEIKAIGDGMATADETWPPLEGAAAGAPAQPTRASVKAEGDKAKPEAVKKATTGKKAKDEPAKAEGDKAPEGTGTADVGQQTGQQTPPAQQQTAADKKAGKYQVVNNDGEPVWDGDDANEFCKQIILTGEKVRTDKKLLDGIWETHLPAILGLTKTLQNYMMQHYPQFEG